MTLHFLINFHGWIKIIWKRLENQTYSSLWNDIFGFSLEKREKYFATRYTSPHAGVF